MTQPQLQINYPFIIQAFKELHALEKQNQYPSSHNLAKYIESVFQQRAMREHRVKCLEQLYDCSEIKNKNSEVYPQFLTFLSRHYTHNSVESELEARLLEQFIPDLIKKPIFTQIINANKDSAHFNLLYKKQKSLLSERATTQDVLDLIKKAARYKDLELIIKILNDNNSQTRSQHQVIDSNLLKEQLIEHLQAQSSYSFWRQVDSSGKIYRLLELLEVPVEVVREKYFNFPKASTPPLFNSNILQAFTFLNAHYAQELVKENPQTAQELLTYVFETKNSDAYSSYYNKPSANPASTLLSRLTELVCAQKTDLKTLKILSPHLMIYLKSKNNKKSQSPWAELKFPQQSAQSSDPQESALYYLLNFISANSDLIKQHTKRDTKEILAALIKIENKNLSKSMKKSPKKVENSKRNNKI